MRLRPAPGVAWVSLEELDRELEPTAYVAVLPRGPAHVLPGPACLVWLCVADGGTLEEITAGTAELAGVAPEVVRDDVARMVAELRELGLVTPG